MRRLVVRGALLAALLSTSAYAPRVLGNTRTVPPANVMTRIRQFLGVQPRTVSVGGTRSRQQAVVCLLAPGPIQKVGEVSEIQLVQSRPNLVFGTPLNEVEIRSGSAVLWSQLATSKGPIQGRIPWPIAPIVSNQRLELAMRPRGAAGGDWAVLSMKGASAEAQQRYAAALGAIGSNGDHQLRQLDKAIGAGDGALAQALLWVERTPNNSALAALQREQLASCQTASTK
jgi:hypothetical protein